MPHKTALTTYLSELVDIRGPGVKETSFYPALSNLLNTVGSELRPKVKCVIHPSGKGAGLPDGALFTADQLRCNEDANALFSQGEKPACGVIEAKGTAVKLDDLIKTVQIAKYLTAYGLVLITNLREFALVIKGANDLPEILERYALADTERAFWKATAQSSKTSAEHGMRFEDFLKRALLHNAPITQPKDLAWILASYAREARARVEAARNMPQLGALRTALEESLGMAFEGERGNHFFRSTLVQTLFYGVFSAWVLWHAENPNRTDRFDWRLTEYYLRVPVLQSLFEQLSSRSKLESLGLTETLKLAGETLNRVVADEFFKRFEQSEAVQYFYEPFLHAFDSDLRKTLGVWYTPPEVVQYMVRRVDAVLRDELGIEDGLANENVVVLDPCCGTGTYLVEVLKQVAHTLKGKGLGALESAALKEAATKRLFGFEILPAPFVVAHLQLSLLLQQLGASLGASERAGVFLTNALTGWAPPTEDAKRQIEQIALNFPEFKQERDAADNLKRTKKIMVVIGNPPYNAFAGISPDEENGLVEPYKRGLIKDWGIKKFNLDDLYIRFFRLAERCIAEMSGEGVVCYISNFSYLSEPSFVVMRQRFLQEFDALWFDGLNGDSRETGKTTPEGAPDPSVFSTEFNREGIRVGTAISLLLRKKQRTQPPPVHFRQFWGVNKRAELLDSLAQLPVISPAYTTTAPEANNRFSFRPSDVTSEYLSWPRLIDLAETDGSQGLSEDRRKALIDSDRDVLKKRMQHYFDKQISFEELQSNRKPLTESYVDFDAPKVRATLLSVETFDEKKLLRYAVRPFDTQYCYFTSVRPIWRRDRPDFFEQLWHENGFIVSRLNPNKSDEGYPVAFITTLCDYHYITPNAVAIPFRLRKTTGAKKKKDEQASLFDEAAPQETITANLSPTARDYLAGLGIVNVDANADSAALIWLHALAIDYAPAYLRENADGIRGDWPRIPLPQSAAALRASAALGQQVAALLNTEQDVSGVTSGNIRADLKVIAVPSTLNNAPLDTTLNASWGHKSSSGIVMPGRGKTVESQQGLNVYLNETSYWANVPSAVWDYTIGGYQVIKKWLSYREQGVLGRALKTEEVREVTHMARRIAALIVLQPQLDANYAICKT